MISQSILLWSKVQTIKDNFINRSKWTESYQCGYTGTALWSALHVHSVSAMQDGEVPVTRVTTSAKDNYGASRHWKENSELSGGEESPEARKKVVGSGSVQDRSDREGGNGEAGQAPRKVCVLIVVLSFQL